MKKLLALLAIALPSLAAEVSGYVYAVDGRAVEGATVRAGNVTTTTNEDGGFVLTGLAEGVVELEIAASGLPTARPLVLTGDVVTVTLTAAEHRDVAVPFPSGAARGEGTVSGRITLDGKPLANVPVVIGEHRVLTNTKGEYAVKELPAGRHAVMVDERLFPRLRSPLAERMYAEGTEPYVADLRKTREAAVDLELLSAPMIRGRVVDADGKPVARARVHLALANRSTLDFAQDPSSARTTPDGRYAFPAPDWTRNEQVSVAVTAPLHSTVRSKPFVLGSTGRTVDVTLPKLETVRIRVLDRAGKPIPDARVAFAAAADMAAYESAHFLVEHGLAERMPRANPEGELVLQLAADTYDFAAAADGFQTGSVTRAIARPATVDLTLERAALLRGRVHRKGRGVANVAVNILGGRSRSDSTATGPDGKFEIGGLAPGTYRVTFFKQEELIERTLEVDAPGEVDVSLPPTGTLRGRVLDSATGAPVREFAYSVEAVPADVNRIHRGESTTDGTFTLQIPAGTYRITAGAANFTSSEPVEVRIVEDETTPVDLPLGRGATITGRVSDESGLPVAGADVMVTPADFPRMRRAARVGPSQTQTAEDGTFTATGIEPGEAQLTVRKQGYVLHRKSLEAEGTMSVDVTLTRGLSIHGLVTRGGKPVPGVQVGASSPAIGGDHQSAVSDDEGRFTLSGLIPARYTVSAFLEDQHTEVRDVDPAKQKELVLSLDPKARGVIYGIVSGVPQAAGGKYIRRVVMVHSEAGGAEGIIDDAGNYRIENAPVGKVTVAAVVEVSARTARTSARREVEVLAGQPLRVDLDLTGSVHVSGRVTIEGKPVVAEIGFSSEDGMMGTARSRQDGSYEVMLGGPGRYQIYARAEQFNERYFQTVREIRGGETVDIDLREQVIEGTVLDAATRQPVANALVTLAPATGLMMSIAGEVPADASGRFRLVTASSGPMRLIVSAPGYAQRTIPVSSATSHYAFELSPAPDVHIRVLDARTGSPLDAHLIFSDEAGILPVRPRRSSDGTTYLFSVAPGRYRVLAIVQGYASKAVEVTAPGGTEIVME